MHDNSGGTDIAESLMVCMAKLEIIKAACVPPATLPHVNNSLLEELKNDKKRIYYTRDCAMPP